MDILCPFLAQCSVRRAGRKIEPLIVLVSHMTVLIGGPDQRWRGVRHHAETFFSFPKCGFSFSFMEPLPQQSPDQDELKENHRGCGNDVIPVEGPNGGLPMQNNAARGERRLR